jgi:arsenate reductase (thioredoxin)
MTIQSELVPLNLRGPLDGIARDLHDKFEGVFGTETIESLVVDSYIKLAARATVTRWLVVSTQRLAGERLDALVHAEDHSTYKVPGVLFLCTHNAGRSQMALGWFTHLVGDRAVAWSGGSAPQSEINPVAVEAMAEVGIDISGGYAKPWTEEVLWAAEFVVTMGCGDACPLVPGKHYEDWDVANPAGQPLSVVRHIRDDLERRVRHLATRMHVELRVEDLAIRVTRSSNLLSAAGSAGASAAPNEAAHATATPHSGRWWSIKNRLADHGGRAQ